MRSGHLATATICFDRWIHDWRAVSGGSNCGLGMPVDLHAVELARALG